MQMGIEVSLPTFSSRNRSVAVVPARREQIWSIIADARALAELTPMVRAIEVDGSTWTWHLRGIKALGVSVTPTFTELMIFDEPGSLRFEHRPPDGRSERAGARGIYTLEAIDAGHTRLAIDLTLCVELPLPRLSRRVVEATMAATMQRTGDRFAANLYARLGLDPAGVDAVPAGAGER
jgi:carbon monoxide dehydrogenase subunit G